MNGPEIYDALNKYVVDNGLNSDVRVTLGTSGTIYADCKRLGCWICTINPDKFTSIDSAIKEFNICYEKYMQDGKFLRWKLMVLAGEGD
jgi:hypothetical protein